jgi:hypothetical protein
VARERDRTDATGIVCTSTVAACISDGGGVCELKKADFTLDLKPAI